MGLHYGAHEGAQRGVFYIKGKEGGHGLHDVVAHVGVGLQAGGARLSARADGDAHVRGEVGDGAVPPGDGLHAQAACVEGECVDDGYGVLRLWEDTLVFLRDESHAVLLKPPAGVLGAEAFEESLHQFVTARVGLLKVGDVGK